MKFPRTLVVFFCAAGAILTIAILKALLISGLDRLPPVKVLIFASTTFGLIAALPSANRFSAQEIFVFAIIPIGINQQVAGKQTTIPYFIRVGYFGFQRTEIGHLQ